jgi:competence protein ComEC
VRACLEHPDPNCAGLLAALLLGDRSGLPPEVVDRFTRTGTRHLLALSGFHVGLLAVLVVLPLARAAAALARLVLELAGSRRRPDGGPLAAAAVLLFVPVSGGGAPATRAAVGLALALLAGPLGRRPSASNLLGVAALVELAVDPLAPLRPGTQLSYLATSALVTLAAPVHRALCGDPAARPWLAATGPTGWPRPALLVAAVERARRLLLAALAAGAVASLATLPVVWCVFGEWSPASLLATPVATPPVAVLMVSGWARILAPGETADAVALLASESLLRWLALVDSLPWTPLPLPERPALALAALTAALLAAARSPARRRRLGSAAALGFGLLLAPWPGPSLGPALGPSSAPSTGTLAAGVAPGPTPRGLEVHVLDVGNGTAVVVRAPGDPTWVLDAGSRDRLAVASEGVGALLRALDVGAVRAAVSHDHADHAGALPWILDRWGSPPPARPHASAPSRVDHPRSTARSAPHRGADARAGRRARTSPWRPHPSGVTWLHGTRASTRGTTSRGTSTWGASTGGLAIAAVASGLPDPNEGSATFDVRWRGAGGREVRALLCGDAEGAGLRRMLEGGDGTPWIEPGPVDLLLMPHHGSETRHLAALLDRTRPALAVVSGEVPGYAAELARRGIPLHVTGRDGPLLWTPAGAAPSPPVVDGVRGAAGAPEERRGPR